MNEIAPDIPRLGLFPLVISLEKDIFIIFSGTF